MPNSERPLSLINPFCMVQRYISVAVANLTSIPLFLPFIVVTSILSSRSPQPANDPFQQNLGMKA